MKSILYLIIQGGFERAEDNYLSDMADNADWSGDDGTWKFILISWGVILLWIVIKGAWNWNNEDYKGPFRD